jgi:aspartate kinase
MTGKIAVGGITRTDNLVLVRILGVAAGHDLSGRALTALGNQGINVACVTSFLDKDGLNNICFAVGLGDLDQTLGILQSLEDHIQAQCIEYQSRCSAVSIYGPHFAERPAIAGRVFHTLGEVGVEVLMISTSFSTVSFVTHEEQAVQAVTKLNNVFLVP